MMTQSQMSRDTCYFDTLCQRMHGAQSMDSRLHVIGPSDLSFPTSRDQPHLHDLAKQAAEVSSSNATAISPPRTMILARRNW
jgi:hypothetical protein